AMRVEGEARGPRSEDRSGRGGGVGAVARDVVGVGVRLDDVRDLQALAPRQSQIFVDAVAARIDDDSLAGLAAADQVREAPGLLVQDLLEDHPGPYSMPRPQCFSAFSFSVLASLVTFSARNAGTSS